MMDFAGKIWMRLPVFRFAFFSFLLLGPFLSFSSNSRVFEFKALSQRRAEGNAVVWVNLSPQLSHVDPQSGAVKTEVDIIIGARRRDNQSLVVERIFRKVITPESFLDGDPFLHQFTIEIPTGDYLLSVEVKDLLNGRIHFSEQFFSSSSAGREFAFSDISLWQKREGDPNGFPVLNAPVNALFKGELIEFRSEVYAPRGMALTARAILYRRQPSSNVEHTDYASLAVERYSSLEQFTSSVRAGSASAWFSGSFNIEKFGAGDYLLEVYLYDGDLLVADETRSFTLEWKDLGKVFGNLEASIRQLEYIAAPDQVKELLAIKNPEESINKFLEFWTQRSEDPQLAIRNYYSLVFEANEKYGAGTKADTLPGWKSDKGKTLCLYGRPSRIDKLFFRGEKLQTWFYDDWGLKFVFNSEARLVREEL